MMKQFGNFWNLVRCFEDCAELNDEVGTDYARGKASAFRYAAQWLRDECKLAELEWGDNHEKESR